MNYETMQVKEFREKIKVDSEIIADGKEFFVEELIRFRFDDGSFYTKCFLSGGYVLADDLNDNFFVLVKEVETEIASPFPKEIEYGGQKFNFLYESHAVAEEIWGKEIFKKGESERFWDYESSEGAYLSLGIHDQTGRRQDFFGKIIKEVKIANLA